MNDTLPVPVAEIATPELIESVRSCEVLRAFAVTTRETFDSATDNRTAIKALQRRIEDARKRAVEPHNAVVKRINEAAKTLAAPLADIDAILERRMIEWKRAEDARIAEEQRRIAEENQRRREEAAAKELAEIEARKAAALDLGLEEEEADAFAEGAAHVVPELEAAPAALPTTTRATIGRAVERTVWQFRVADEYAVPREYLSVNESAIRAAVRAGAREIPGVEIWAETRLDRR